jgi:CAAX protease family protein
MSSDAVSQRWRLLAVIGTASRRWRSRKEDVMSTMKAFITKHPVLTYFALTFALSWGGFLLVGGSGLLAGTSWQADPRFMAAVFAMLAGPPVAGVLLTVLVSGRAGLRELISRLFKWRVGGRWYAIALLTAPIVETTVLLVLSRISPVFPPAIDTTDDKAALLVSGIAIGLAGGFVEELGWTGFAIPRLTVRYGVLGTGLIVGPVWVAWHLLQMWWVGATSSETLPLALFLPLFFLSAGAILTAYRVLMVWVYDRTGSLLVAVLMHASYIFSTLFVLAPPTTGVPFLTYSGVFAVALWVVVAAVTMANGGKLSRQPLRRAA